ncbi:HD domain-containing phosphohydrolase [Propionispora hippei]|uniref:GAF domain-containing protein n=1 Tax=Propionispora hippei DSM 15287 TaxID=1123003 RepID=A0A1M6F0J6_9FIRM|nr:HD domain-containing phosphohydrolase [Propionispora hippei]SHI91161.1 GAF domain-containing protein [Propionispora hippei DSM 15287]
MLQNNNTSALVEPDACAPALHIMEELLKVVQQLSATHDLQAVMDIVRHSVRELTGSDGATFVLRDGEFCYYAEEDAITPLWKGLRFPMEICISGWVMRNRQPTIIEDIYHDDRIPIDVYRKTFVRSLAMVPIKTNDPIGAIGCYWSKVCRPTAEQVQVLHVLADTAAIAMDNIGYQESIASQARQLEEAIDGTLLTVAKMVELKDPYTSGHQRRVGILSYDIACELGWDKKRCEMLRRAAIVHDIGKIGIPGELLTKPSKLTPQEFGLIQTHAAMSYDILKDVHFLMPIAKIILQHHERLNGSGYPHGLTGEQILPEAKIIAVADVFEAMTSHRPYRPAPGMDAALEELLQNKGVLYDPGVVNALIRLVREKNYCLPE